MSRVVLQQVVKQYGSVTALESLDLEIQEGEFLTLLGPSGCGKTTTLRLIAGFILRFFVTPTDRNTLDPGVYPEDDPARWELDEPAVDRPSRRGARGARERAQTASVERQSCRSRGRRRQRRETRCA